ncbi:HesB/IscA family protein [Candidatus Gromoviella agglomerans]|uniref:HesB/IscA family protein n=1 Tax=Candidatus Gromoviella agglomerans TaxID=2806609 RepID=UPI001E5CF0D3|nr:iron-sulfur cluster assembly accessory protein [Candidatus Gromoviella agglomerans]
MSIEFYISEAAFTKILSLTVYENPDETEELMKNYNQTINDFDDDFIINDNQIENKNNDHQIQIDKDKKTHFRIQIQGGGCSGFEYNFSITQEKDINDAELTIQSDEDQISLLIDKMSLNFLSGAYLDYKIEVIGSRFLISNPNACGTCSCGSSFECKT